MANPKVNPPVGLDTSKYLEPKRIIRAAVDPSWTIRAYRITSDDLEEYLGKKVNTLVPGARVKVQPRYIENKLAMKKKARYSAPSAVTQSYASLLVALSAETIDKGNLDPAYRWIVSGTNDVKMVDNVYNVLIKGYRYNRDELKAILKDYAALDHLKERFGITEEYIRNLINLNNPVRQPDAKGTDGWVIFAASAEKIINDYLTDVMVYEPKPEFINPNDPDAPTTRVIPTAGPAGTMEIIKVNAITQGKVEYIVYVHVGEFQASNDPELKKLFDSFK